MAFTVPVSIVTNIELGRFDLDPILPPPDRRQGGFHLPTDKVTPILGPAWAVDRFETQSRSRGLAERGDHGRRSSMSPAPPARSILNSLKIGSLAGARASLQAAIANYWTKEPKGQCCLRFSRAPDIDRVLKLAGSRCPGSAR